MSFHIKDLIMHRTQQKNGRENFVRTCNLNGTTLLILLFFCLASFSVSGQDRLVTGKVIDTDGVELIGVNILQKGTNNGTVTDFDGNYSISLIDGEGMLTYSYTGYQSVTEEVGGRSEINITLTSGATLDEVVVVGYGRQKKSDLTGAVASVKVEDLEGIPTSRVDQILQGRSAGVQITNVSGAPGAGTVIRVRGGNSIEGNNEPLWVIDGIIVGQNYNLNNLNPNDIASIEVLKDASSVAIYGSRGANGVILVTTKLGTKVAGGKPVVSVGLSSGIQSALGRPALLNGVQHAEYANEDARFRNTSEPFPDISSVTNTDWFDIIMRDAAMYSADVSVAGSSEDGGVNYYVSGNYFNQDGIVETTGIQKFILRSNLDIKLSEKVRAGVRLNFSQFDTDNGVVGYGNVFNLGEIPARDADGNFTQQDPISGGPYVNALANSLLNINESQTNNFLGTVFLEYSPLENLIIRSTFNPEINNVKRNRFNSPQRPDYQFVGNFGDASVNTVSSLGWNNENTIQYSPNIGDNQSLTILGGMSAQKFTLESSFAQAFGITSDATTFNNLALGSDPTRNTIGSGYDAFQIVSFFGRVNYSLQNKYLFTLVGRADGSSRFAEGNKYNFFPSVAVAWKLSEEQFIADMGLFDELKLRASYGRSGSQAIESFRTLAIITDASTSYNGVLASGATLGRPANEQLKWETTNQLDIALEASFLNGRIFTELNYYKKNTFDLLLNVRLPRQTGFESRLQNLGEVQNKGLELLVNTVNVSKPSFKWSSMLTLSGNRNKVLDLGGVDFINIVSPNAQSGPGGRLIVGQPAPVFVGVDYLGTWKTQEEIDASGQQNQDIGGARFDDPNGDGIITEDDFYVLGSPQPDFIYGLQNTFKFRNLEFSFFIQGTQGNEVSNSRTVTHFFGRPGAPKYEETLNRWTPENPTSDIPRAGAMEALGEIPNNSEFIEDGSHLRLKSVRLGYDLPVDKWGLGNFRSLNVYVVGSNLLLLSDFRLLDPETSQFGNGNVTQGFASGQFPNPRIVTFGLNASF
ncbi:SusC/RagA family TonB-linked outer membrane protein [Neolewinella agarilytica]|uniref:TonB-linked outer membrane protein, SusC/RagA family n=1 Tax=Neolewinella agarilytica TaxID=478744 RepID=A0A1H9D6M9_9BACT|nr:TonB-dependent receptor [Neolewinella agarilytica]SEQ09007.1 TonB-linked outer membrane protein, SusC/RagA family [Neolewinella agarilytica]